MKPALENPHTTALRVRGSQMRNETLFIHGYKHSLVQIVAASLALNRAVLVSNAPEVWDTWILAQIFNKSGGRANKTSEGWLYDPRGFTRFEIDRMLSHQIHGSLYLMPALATRLGAFEFGHAGGCQIGNNDQAGQRPVDHVLSILSTFGMAIDQSNEIISGKRKITCREVDIDIDQFSEERGSNTGPLISGATKSALLCALGTNRTTVRHPYTKTDVQDLLRFIVSSESFEVTTDHDQILIARKHANFSKDPIPFELTDCVSEIMTFITLAVVKNLELQLTITNGGKIAKLLAPELSFLEQMGLKVIIEPNTIYIPRAYQLHPLHIHVTNSSIQSDHHPLFTLMLLGANGPSTIFESVWRDRFAYVQNLTKLGARLEVEGNCLRIYPSKLHRSNQSLQGYDTRATAVAILAALEVPGTTIINSLQHLFRGYGTLLRDLASLGADLKPIGERLEAPPEITKGLSA